MSGRVSGTVTRLGVNVPNFGPTASPDNLLAWARFAEDAGFAIAMMSDHVAPTPDVAALYPDPFYDPKLPDRAAMDGVPAPGVRAALRRRGFRVREAVAADGTLHLSGDRARPPGGRPRHAVS